MSKVYLPNISNENCIVILDKDTIRVYDSLPVSDSYVNYTDYYINSHYLEKTGREFINIVPSCENINNFTDDYYYRNDLADILLIFLILAIFIVILPFKIISRAFGRWLKV